jgi:hypothetical protein
MYNPRCWDTMCHAPLLSAVHLVLQVCAITLPVNHPKNSHRGA